MADASDFLKVSLFLYIDITLVSVLCPGSYPAFSTDLIVSQSSARQKCLLLFCLAKFRFFFFFEI